AGPLAGFGLLGLVIVAEVYILPQVEPGPSRLPLQIGLFMLYWINLVWGLMNLLPIWPLDGGQISRELCIWLSPWNGPRVALGISFVLAALIAVHCLMAANGRPLIPFLPIGSMYSAILFAMLAVESFMLLQQTSTRPRYRDDDDPWAR